MATKTKARKPAKQASKPDVKAAASALNPKLRSLARHMGLQCAKTDADIIDSVRPLVTAYPKLEAADQKTLRDTFLIGFMGGDKIKKRTEATAKKILAKQRPGSKKAKGKTNRSADEQGSYFRAYSKFRFYIINGGILKPGQGRGANKTSKAASKRNKAEALLRVMGDDLQAAIAMLRKVYKK